GARSALLHGGADAGANGQTTTEAAPRGLRGIPRGVLLGNCADALVRLKVGRNRIAKAAGEHFWELGEQISPERALVVGVILKLRERDLKGIAGGLSRRACPHRDQNGDAVVVGPRQQARGDPPLTGLVERPVGPVRRQTERALVGLVVNVAGA